MIMLDLESTNGKKIAQTIENFMTLDLTGVGLIGALPSISGYLSTCVQSLGGRRPSGPDMARHYGNRLGPRHSRSRMP